MSCRHEEEEEDVLGNYVNYEGSKASVSDHGLPPDTENTNILPYHLFIHLIEASTSLKPSFKKLIENFIEQGNPPLCIIADIFFGWTASIAKELNVFHAIFTVSSAYGLACYYSLWMNLPHRKENSDEFSLPDFAEASNVHITQLPTNILEADGTDAWSVFQSKNLPEWVNSDGILVNTVEEFDQVGLLYFKRKLGSPAWPIGPILLSRENREGGMSLEPCIEWLNTKPLKSVLYVSFGSQNTISASQMMQLAMGLEASDKNFIWSFNAKLLEEEMGVCVEVARGKSCEVRHEDIAAKIELVMNETQQKGKEMRRKAFEAREMIRNAIKDEGGFKGSSVKAMDEFFSAALSMREKTMREQNVVV
nr:udp-glycosyltransferase 92a1 [Quercus suber]